MMKTKLTEMFGIDLPVFAFSHCRDVVVEVSKAGGFGVLGCAYQTPEQLKQELQWIDDHIEGKPYGIDLLMPGKFQQLDSPRLTLSDLPKEQTDYLRRWCDAADVPRLPEDIADELIQAELDKLQFTPDQAKRLLDVALEHPIKAVVNALGAPDREMVDALHARSIKVGSLIGKLQHAERQISAGVDFIVAQGHEAGGHSGKISSMILWPQIVDAVAPVPVLAAGGIGRGRQMAAALALGVDGIWCGSIWLGTSESEVMPEIKDRFFEASPDDAIQTRARTGKPVRMLRSQLTDAWDQEDAPPFLPMPLQTAVMVESRLRVERTRDKRFLTYPVGQIVGEMRHESTCRQVIHELLDEYVEAVDRLYSINPQE
jgi:NAD(P)H-dependent flavin oxidoreductase YrpB (nitropropane dioxygenase family)